MLEAAIPTIHPFSAHLITSSVLFPKNGSAEGSVCNYQQMQSSSSLAQRAMKPRMSSSSPEEGGKEKNQSIYGCQFKGQ